MGRVTGGRRRRPGRRQAEDTAASGSAGLLGRGGARYGCAKRPADHDGEGQPDRHHTDKNGFRGQEHVNYIWLAQGKLRFYALIGRIVAWPRGRPVPTEPSLELDAR
ncbi:hypothetical protein Areg01_68530 [Actinoplanes regularis]|nr:hypothetical protein Areg01_68530 [Actinoplanes regularis]